VDVIDRDAATLGPDGASDMPDTVVGAGMREGLPAKDAGLAIVVEKFQKAPVSDARRLRAN
jgi:hypothetical protein